MKLSQYAIQKPITTVMLTLSVLVMGAISLIRLPLEYAPDASWPSMYVEASYPSSSPEEIERSITRPVEEIMGTLPRIKSMRAQSSSSRASVRLEFDYGTDMDLMAVQVRDRLDQVRGRLPDDLEHIQISRWNLQDRPILYYLLSWQGDDPTELSNIYKYTILPRLQRLEGVGNIGVRGLDDKVLLVDVDPDLLSAYKLDIRALNQSIRANNVNISAGYVRDADRRLPVRTLGELEAISQLRHLPIRNGIELTDVADVSYDYPEKKYFERMDGQDAITVEIRKTSTANLVATADRVKNEIDEILSEVGGDKLRIQLVRDRSVEVTQGIQNLAQSALLGGILAIGVIFIFLRNFRSTLIIGSAIPISGLCVFVIMYFLRELFGATITVNLVSMMGLMVSIGMLVDPAVVTLENIYRKRFEEGLDSRTAAMEGSQETGLPILIAALTTICVFIPIIFVSGSGNSLWMKDFAPAVCISVVASLGVAMTLVPLAGSRAYGQGGKNLDLGLKLGLFVLVFGAIAYQVYTVGGGATLGWVWHHLSWLISGLANVPVETWAPVGLFLLMLAVLYYRFRHIGLKTLYVGVARTTLRYRWTTVVVACGVLGLGFYLYAQIEKRPFRWQPSRRIDLSVEVPRSYDIEAAQALFKRVEDILIPRKAELDISAISTRFSTRYSNRITLYLTPTEEARLSTDEVKARIKPLLPQDIPGVRFKLGRSGGSGSAEVGIEIKGRNSQTLEILAEDIKLRLQNIPGVQEIESNLESGLEEIQVSVNRKRAQRYGLSPRQVATTIATALGSRGNNRYKTDDGEIDINLRFREEDRATLEQLKNVSIESDNGTMVSFSSLADFRLKKGRRSITRKDRMTTVDVYATTEAAARYSAGLEMSRRMQEIPLPAGYTWQMDRSFRSIAEEQSETNFTLIFAAILIYLIMASLFESYIHPFTIMFSICFAFTGVALGLYIFNVPLDSSAQYGLLILFGIAVNNGIVLVDHINRYRRQGLFRRDAIIRGGQDRIRPILMTATTTVLGLAPLVVPMIYGTAEGYARRWGPIGLVVICGLSVSTVLTLILLPTIYSLMDDLAKYAKQVMVRT
ncbi:MAG: efflux RND transporter permease subunit [bacterium]|nr:efflux RND transporter permease subunit [bacterium]